jgi:hypothetical protein
VQSRLHHEAGTPKEWIEQFPTPEQIARDHGLIAITCRRSSATGDCSASALRRRVVDLDVELVQLEIVADLRAPDGHPLVNYARAFAKIASASAPRRTSSRKPSISGTGLRRHPAPQNKALSCDPRVFR